MPSGGTMLAATTTAMKVRRVGLGTAEEMPATVKP